MGGVWVPDTDTACRARFQAVCTVRASTLLAWTSRDEWYVQCGTHCIIVQGKLIHGDDRWELVGVQTHQLCDVLQTRTGAAPRIALLGCSWRISTSFAHIVGSRSAQTLGASEVI